MTRRSLLSVGFLGCFLIAATVLLAGSPAPTGNISVGDFAVMVASRLEPGETSNQHLTPERAAEILSKHKVKINSDLTSALTEKDATDMFRQLGITLQSANPDNPLSAQHASALVGIFESHLNSAGTKTNGSVIRTTGGSSTTVNPDTTPLDCQSLPRPPSPCVGPQSVCNPCMDCCKNQLGLTGKTCGHLCQKANLVVSGSEPTP